MRNAWIASITPLSTMSQPSTSTVPRVAAGAMMSAIVPRMSIRIPNTRNHPHRWRRPSSSINKGVVIINSLAKSVIFHDAIEPQRVEQFLVSMTADSEVLPRFRAATSERRAYDFRTSTTKRRAGYSSDWEEASAAAMADDLPATSSTGPWAPQVRVRRAVGCLGGASSTVGLVRGYGGQCKGSRRKLTWSYWWGCLPLLICEQPRSHWFARQEPVDANLDLHECFRDQFSGEQHALGQRDGDDLASKPGGSADLRVWG